MYDCSTGPRREIETATCTEMTLAPSTVSQHAADLHHSAEATHARMMEQSSTARSAQNCFQNEIIDVLEVLA